MLCSVPYFVLDEPAQQQEGPSGGDEEGHCSRRDRHGLPGKHAEQTPPRQMTAAATRLARTLMPTFERNDGRRRDRPEALTP